MSIKSKLIILLAVIGITTTMLGVGGFVALAVTSEKTRTIVTDRVVPLQRLTRVVSSYMAINRNARNAAAVEISFRDAEAMIGRALSEAHADWEAYLAGPHSPKEVQQIESTKAMMAASDADLEELRAVLASDSGGNLNQFNTIKLQPATDGMAQAMGNLVQLQVQIAQEEYGRAEAVRASSVAILGGLSAIGLIVLGLATFIVLHGVVGPLRRMESSMRRLAQGDLDAEVPYAARRDEIGAMADAVEVFKVNAIKIAELTEEDRAQSEKRRTDRAEMMQALQRAFGEVVDAAAVGDFSQRVAVVFPDPELNTLAKGVNNLVATVERGLTETGAVLGSLARADLTASMNGDYQGAFGKLKDDANAVGLTFSGIVARLRSTSSSLKSAVAEIMTGANDLSARTTRQAAAITETANAMEQLARTVSDNVLRAEQASLKAQSVSQTAGDTGEVMRKSNDAMGRISSSSSRISNIIGLIDDIAFQTNLLALNASVEAARAGDSGRGFAVVAVEVRRLAQSAAGASSEVKALVDQSRHDVVEGGRLVAEATEKLDLMLTGVRENADLIESIAQATKEQSGAIAEVNQSIRQIDEVTQHNAALAKETNAAMEQSREQAAELDNLVEVFVVKEEVMSRAA